MAYLARAFRTSSTFLKWVTLPVKRLTLAHAVLYRTLRTNSITFQNALTVFLLLEPAAWLIVKLMLKNEKLRSMIPASIVATTLWVSFLIECLSPRKTSN